MEYLLARWYAVRQLSPQRLKTLHNFEAAVKLYSSNKAAQLKKQKIFLPLWWQEGALFLNKEFKAFWQYKNLLTPAQLAAFKSQTSAVLLEAGIKIEDGRIFEDISFMHRCDLALNASARNAGQALPQSHTTSITPAPAAAH